MPNYLTVRTVRSQRGVLVCAAVGELDAATVPRLRRELIEVERHTPPELVVDLSRLTFLSAAGVRLLLVTAGHAASDRRRVVLVTRDRAVCRVLDLCGVAPAVRVYATLDDAFDRLRPRTPVAGRTDR